MPEIWTARNNNYFPTTDGDVLYAVKEGLKAETWTVPKSGDGASGFSNSGDIITTATLMATNNAWFVVQMPASANPRISYCFQRVSSSVWRAWQSTDGFTGGSPSATVRPTASDEQQVLNNGTTNPWPSFSYGNQKMDLVTGNADTGFSFYMIMKGVLFPGSIYGMIACDVLRDRADLITYGDVDPSVTLIRTDNFGSSAFVNNDGLNNIASASTGGQGIFGWYKKGLSGAAFVAFTPVLEAAYGVSNLDPVDDGMSTTATGLLPRTPVKYARGGSGVTTPGRKGTSTLLSHINPAFGSSAPFADVDREIVSYNGFCFPFPSGMKLRY